MPRRLLSLRSWWKPEAVRILGAHILGHAAAEIIHLFSWAMKLGMTTQDMKDQVYVYPTFANDIKFLI